MTDGSGALLSKNTYSYDLPNYFEDTSGAAVQHDRINYGPGLVYGRGNLSETIRWDVTDPQNTTYTAETFLRVNSTGSVIRVVDPSDHQTSFDYVDSYSDGINRNTFAFPSIITDAAGYETTAQYQYDFGAVTRTRDQKFAFDTITYDLIGRPVRVTKETGAYTRWEYPSSQNSVNTFSTIQEGAGESFTTQVFDGAGRVYLSVGAMPGSVGGFSAQWFQYDAMGRLRYQSNPAEVNGAWVPVGDDAAGWQWTEQWYDYLGRPITTINPDGTARGTNYGGCGCAGGEIKTFRDEVGRTTRTTQDALGRQSKVEELNWDQSVYSTTNFAYNARDQIISITQQNDRARTFEYDGHGRLWRRTTPEQGLTTFTYTKDDMVERITDARGAWQNFAYNSRHLPWSLTYGTLSGVEETNMVQLGYDSAGNRIWMTDGFGRVDYVYNNLSRLTSETRTFAELGSFTLSYEYNLGGELTRITNPWNVQVGYDHDSMGRLTRVSGANYAGVNNYITSIGYRAFGGTKGINYGNGKALSSTYDNRLRLTGYDVSGVLGYNYHYNNTYLNEWTNRVSYAQNLYDATLDRSYQYDQVGRLVVAHSGAEARAHALNGQWGTQDGPFSQGYNYDVWGNITGRSGWGGWNPAYASATFNNKNQMTTNPATGVGMQYDAAGNLTFDGWQSFTYDAAGSQVQAPMFGVWQGHDGDGLRVRNVDNGTNSGTTTYYLRSTVLGGQVVAEMNGIGQWTRGYVYAGEQLVALQQGGVYWAHQDPVNKSQRLTDVAGNVVAAIELDPWGAETTRSWNGAMQPHRFTSYERGSTGDESLFRRYHGWWSRFAHPDPSDGSYNLSDPQSFNRYSYVQNDPVNFVDPSGLNKALPHIGTFSVDVYVSWLQRMMESSFAENGGDFGWMSDGPGIWGPYDPSDPGTKSEPQNPVPTPKPNPNCIMNAVGGATGLNRPFGNVGPSGIIGHDGMHVVAPSGSRVTTLSALTGTVLGIHNGGDGTKIVDVQLDRGGFVALYKDLVTVNIRPGQHLGTGITIGTIGAYEGGGLHFALLNGGRQADQYYRSLTSTNQTNKIMVGMFTNPNGPNSPVNCPGVSVNNAGVNPHP